MSVTVSGFGEQLHSLNGVYTATGKENHGRPVFHKPVKTQEQQQSVIYFWDERDGDEMTGWWMAPVVGGEHVWTHNQSSDRLPPKSGWRVPWHDDVDPTVTFIYLAQGSRGDKGGNNQGANNSSASKGPIDFGGNQTNNNKGGKGKNQQQNNSIFNNVQGQQAKGGNNGMKNDKGGNNDNIKYDMKDNHNNPGKGGKKGGKNNKANNQLPNGGNNFNFQDNQRAGQQQQQQQKSEEEAKRRAEEEKRRQGEREKREKEQKAKEEDRKKTQAKKLEELKAKEAEWQKLLDGEYKGKITKFEELLESYKDATAVLTSDVADHLTPEDTMSAYNEGKAVMDKMEDIYKEIKNKFKEIDRDAGRGGGGSSVEFWNKFQSTQKKFLVSSETYDNLSQLCDKYLKKAKKELAERERIEKLEKQKAERKRQLEWNKEIISTAAEDVILGELAVKKSKTNASALPAADLALKRAAVRINEALADKAATEHTKEELRSLLKRTRNNSERVASAAKKQKVAEDEKKDSIVFDLIGKFRQYVQDNDGKDDLFEKFSEDGEMSLELFVKLCMSVEFTGSVSIIFGNALKACDKDPDDELNASEFKLYLQHCYFRADEETVISETESSSVGQKIEKEEILEVLNIVTVDDQKKYHVERLKDGKTGYVPTMKNGRFVLSRFTPQYECVQETVLTDSLELKGFKVLKRLKAGDKFHATEIPVASKQTGLLRIKGDAGDVNGWTTIRGNQGTRYLKICVEEKKTVDEEKIEPLAEAERRKVLETMKKEHSEQMAKAMSEAAESVEMLDTKCLEVSAIFEAQPSKEQIEELSDMLDTLHKAAQNNLTSAKVLLIEKSRAINNCTNSGPLGDLNRELSTMPDAINKLQEQVLALTKKSNQQLKVLLEAELDRVEKEKEEKSQERVKTLEDEMAAMEIKIEDEVTTGEAIIEIVSNDLEELDKAIQNCMETLTRIKKWIDEAVLKDCAGIKCVKEFKVRLAAFRGRMQKLRHRIKDLKTRREQMNADILAKVRLSVGVSLRTYVSESNLTPEQIFDGATDMPFDKFVKVCKEASCNAEEKTLKLVFQRMTSTALTLDEFTFICEPRFIGLKATAMTDNFNLKESKNICRIETGDVVQVLAVPEFDDNVKVHRAKVKSLQGGEEKIGYVTIKGNQGTEFFKQYQAAYVVSHETVMTSVLQMKGFKVLRRLKLGEILKTTETPTVDETGLLRIKGRMAQDEIEGWVTVTGNQGTIYLTNCDRPIETPPTEPAVKEMKDEAPAEDKAPSKEEKLEETPAEDEEEAADFDEE